MYRKHILSDSPVILCSHSRFIDRLLFRFKLCGISGKFSLFATECLMPHGRSFPGQVQDLLGCVVGTFGVAINSSQITGIGKVSLMDSDDDFKLDAPD